MRERHDEAGRPLRWTGWMTVPISMLDRLRLLLAGNVIVPVRVYVSDQPNEPGAVNVLADPTIIGSRLPESVDVEELAERYRQAREEHVEQMMGTMARVVDAVKENAEGQR